MRLHVRITFALALLGWALSPTLPGATPEAERPAGFHPPEVILNGSPYGRLLLPAFTDIDGDGRPDLFVGVTAKSGGGRLLVHSNRGTKRRPAYKMPSWLDERVPSARIPDG